MDNWGLRSKKVYQMPVIQQNGWNKIRGEVDNLTRMNNHSGANLRGEFARNIAVLTYLSLIHIHIVHNKRPRSKNILSEFRHRTKSMVRWQILTRTNDHSGANLGSFCSKCVLSCCINLFRSQKGLLHYDWTKEDQWWRYISLTVSTQYTTLAHKVPYLYHSQIAQSNAKLEQMLVRKGMS